MSVKISIKTYLWLSMSSQIAKTEDWKINIWLSGPKMLSFGNTICVAQVAAQPKSSFPFYEKLITYISPMVAALTAASNKTYLTKLFSRPTALKLQILASLVKKYNVHAGFFRLHMKGIFFTDVLWPFGKNVVFRLVTLVRTRDSTVNWTLYIKDFPGRESLLYIPNRFTME